VLGWLVCLLPSDGCTPVWAAEIVINKLRLLFGARRYFLKEKSESNPKETPGMIF